MRSLRLLLLVTLLVGVVIAHAQADDFDDILDEYVGDDDPSVVLLVTVPGEIDYVGVRGLADLDAATPARTTDRYRIGSITKTFVAVVMLQLQDEEILALDDPISDWLPNDLVAAISYGDEITLYHLLSMTSGIFSYTDSDAYNDAVEADPTHPWTAAETIAFIVDEPADFPPGEGWYYSNSNYNLLQLVIESATGQPLAAVLNAYIFDPVGMSNSFLEDPARIGQGIVRGYALDDDDEWVDVTDLNDGIGLGDGGIVSTAADMERFARALFEGDLLSAEAFEEMSDWLETDEADSYYGLGLAMDDSDYGEVWGHDGATAGFQSVMAYHPDTEAVIILLTNDFDSELMEDLLYDILDAIAD